MIKFQFSTFFNYKLVNHKILHSILIKLARSKVFCLCFIKIIGKGGLMEQYC